MKKGMFVFTVYSFISHLFCETLDRIQRTNSKLKTIMTPFCRDSVLFFQLAPQIFLVFARLSHAVSGRTLVVAWLMQVVPWMVSDFCVVVACC